MSKATVILKPVWVLVVEDEALTRMAAVNALTDARFDCLEPGHSAEALEHLAARPSQVMVVCTDVHMPGEIDGLALANHASLSWPSIAIIVMSRKALPKVGELPAGARFLPKPYATETLVAHVRDFAAAAEMVRGMS